MSSSYLDHLLLDSGGQDFCEFLPVDDRFFEGYLQQLADQPEPASHVNTIDVICAELSGSTQRPNASSGDSAQMVAPPYCPAGTGATATSDPHCRVGSSSPPDPPSGTSPAVAAERSTSESRGGVKPARKRPRWKNRTEQQEAVHKLAQMRYRERKKAKAASLRESAAQLKGQAAELAQLKSANEKLVDENSFLEAELDKRDAETAQLRQALLPLDLKDGSAPEPSHEDMMQCLQRDFSSGIKQLQQLLLQLGGGPDSLYSAAAESVAAPEMVSAMEGVLAKVVDSCFRLARLEGPDLQELIEASVEGCASLEEWTGRPELYRRTVTALALSPEQRAQLLSCRERWLLDLERLFAERQAINLHLIGALLPPVVVQPAAAAVPGLQAMAGDDEEKAALMRRLDDNLRAEQRMWCQQDSEGVAILSPIQAAIFCVAVYPNHCDPLGLVNAIYEMEERALS